MERNPFEDLDALTTPRAAELPAPGRKPKRTPRPRTEGDFYLVPVAWIEKAGTVLTSAEQLLFVLRLYRGWKTRKADTITVGNALVGGNERWRRKMKQQVLERLTAAGLVEVLPTTARKAPRVRVL